MPYLMTWCVMSFHVSTTVVFLLMKTSLSERFCQDPGGQVNGEKDVCQPPYHYKDTCSFRCLPGYELQNGGLSTVKCTLNNGGTQPTWNSPTACVGQYPMCEWSMLNHVL